MMRFLLLVLLASASLQADFSVSPLLLNFQVPPGEESTQWVDVTNAGKKQLSVELYAKDFSMNTLGRESELEPGSHERGCAQWLQLAPSRPITLQPGETKKVRVSLRAPKDSDGLYYSKLYVSETSEPESMTGQQGGVRMTVFMKQRWEVRVHQEVPNTLKREGVLTDMQIERVDESQALRVKIAFDNRGNSLLRCEGRIEIRDNDGNTISTLPLGSEGIFHLYPEMTRWVEATTDTDLTEGNYVALAIIDYGEEHLVAGELPFSVGQLSERGGDSGSPATAIGTVPKAPDA